MFWSVLLWSIAGIIVFLMALLVVLALGATSTKSTVNAANPTVKNN